MPKGAVKGAVERARRSSGGVAATAGGKGGGGASGRRPKSARGKSPRAGAPPSERRGPPPLKAEAEAVQPPLRPDAALFVKSLAPLPTLCAALRSLPYAAAAKETDSDVILLEASLGDVRVHRAADGCDALPGAAPLGYELLALHTPDATHAVLASLLGALAAAGASPHLPSVRSWAVDGAAPSGTLRVALAKPAQTLEQALDSALDYAALYGADGCVPAAERPTTLFGAAAAPPVADRYSGVAADGVGAQQPPPPPLVTYSGGSVPRLSLERVSSVTALRKLEGEAAAVTPPTPPPNPAEAFGDFVLFAVCHTLALLQDACELQHNALTPAAIHLVPASALHFRGAPRAARPHHTNVWGDALNTFRTPSRI